MCGEAACACRWAGLSHFSTTTNVSSPYFAGELGASITGPYSMQPASACTAGTLARNAARTVSRWPGLVVMTARTWIMFSAPWFDGSRRGRAALYDAATERGNEAMSYEAPFAGLKVVDL